jgi:hypothetical protein
MFHAGELHPLIVAEKVVAVSVVEIEEHARSMHTAGHCALTWAGQTGSRLKPITAP